MGGANVFALSLLACVRGPRQGLFSGPCTNDKHRRRGSADSELHKPPSLSLPSQLSTFSIYSTSLSLIAVATAPTPLLACLRNIASHLCHPRFIVTRIPLLSSYVPITPLLFRALQPQSAPLSSPSCGHSCTPTPNFCTSLTIISIPHPLWASSQLLPVCFSRSLSLILSTSRGP